MSQNKSIKFAVVGAGHIGKRHAEMIKRHSEAELVALCDIKDKDQLDIAHFKVPFFQNIEELLTANLDIDVVNICTPNGLHAKQCLQALSSNKHVVCENAKPIFSSF